MADRCCVLLLEPELWRWIGLGSFLHTMIDECGGDLVDRVRSGYRSAMVLVHGDSESMATATPLTRGARG